MSGMRRGVQLVRLPRPMHRPSSRQTRMGVLAAGPLLGFTLNCQQIPSLLPPILFELRELPFHLESDVSPAFNPPESMAGGIAVFDYNGDGRPDIFFTNGADLATMKKSSAKYSNRLFRNDGNGVFTDVTTEAGLVGTGFDI